MERSGRLLVFLVMAILMFCFAGPVFAEDEGVKFNLKVGGLFSMPKVEYDYGWSETYLEETMSLSNSLTPANPFGGSFGASLSFAKNFEIYGNYSFAKKDMASDVSFVLPSFLLFEEIASANSTLNLEYEENIIDLGIAFRFPLEKATPYFGAGISHASVKTETPATVNFTDVHEGEWYTRRTCLLWWCWVTRVFEFEEHAIDIDSIDTEKHSLSATGFHVKAGTNFMVSSHVGFFVEGKYTFIKMDLPVELSAVPGDIAYLGDVEIEDDREGFFPDSPEKIEINPGGLAAIGGIIISF